MNKGLCNPISIKEARTGKRVRVMAFAPGTAIVPTCQPLQLLGYWPRPDGGLTLYVNGSMPKAMRTAVEEKRAHEEVLLVGRLPAGIQEIDYSECRAEFLFLLPPAHELAVLETEVSYRQAA